MDEITTFIKKQKRKVAKGGDVNVIIFENYVMIAKLNMDLSDMYKQKGENSLAQFRINAAAGFLRRAYEWERVCFSSSVKNKKELSTMTL